MSNTVSQLLIEVDSNGVRTLTGDLDLLTKAGKKNEKQTETLEQSTRKLTKQFELQARNAGKSANQIKILDLKAKGATKAQLDAARAAMKNAEAMKKQADAARFASQSAGETNGAFRAMRGSTQQLSWQLQDVAVQAQMGTSAFTIMGQQGPQIASIFGSGGAVFGALIAFGSILAGAVYKSLTGTGDAMKKLKEINGGLIDSFDDLTAAQKRYARSLVLKEIKENEQAIADLEEQQSMATRTVLKGSFAYTEAAESVENYAKRLLKVNSDIDSLKAENISLASSVDDVTDSTEDLVKKLREEILELQLTEEQFLRYKAAQAGATDAQIEGIVAAQNFINNEEEKAEALENATKALESQIEEQQNYTISLNHQLVLLSLSGDALYLYQASLKGGTMAQIQANAELLKSIALRKEKTKADADADKAKIKANNDAVKAQAKADADALKQGDQAQKLMQKIQQANMTELEQLEAHLIKKGGLLFQYLEEGHITLDQYLAMDAELQATYRTAEEEAQAESDKKKLDSAKAYADAKASIDQQVLASASAIVGDLAGLAKEGSAAQKALFYIQKAIAIASTVMNAEIAATAALAQIPAPANVAYASMIRTMGYASAGIIAGTAIAGGRALGGQVRGGESYLVGERGPELLTMGTSGRIASNDSLKNAVGGDSGSGVTINQTINVTTGIQSTVRAEIVSLMPQIAQAAKGAVADGRQRGGNFSRAMSGA